MVSVYIFIAYFSDFGSEDFSAQKIKFLPYTCGEGRKVEMDRIGYSDGANKNIFVAVSSTGHIKVIYMLNHRMMTISNRRLEMILNHRLMMIMKVR